MKNAQTINTIATVYAKVNAADTIAFAKPMRGVWYWFMAPMNPQNIAALISTVETSDEGLKARFRPSNGAFYRAAKLADAEVHELASVEYVDSRMASMSAETGSRVNRGNVIEELISLRVSSDEWHYNPLQRAFYDIPDVIADDGRWLQVKAYGASVTEKDLQDALQALKQRG